MQKFQHAATDCGGNTSLSKGVEQIGGIFRVQRLPQHYAFRYRNLIAAPGQPQPLILGAKDAAEFLLSSVPIQPIGFLTAFENNQDVPAQAGAGGPNFGGVLFHESAAGESIGNSGPGGLGRTVGGIEIDENDPIAKRAASQGLRRLANDSEQRLGGKGGLAHACRSHDSGTTGTAKTGDQLRQLGLASEEFLRVRR